jgi:hypothetical protein
MRTALFTTSIGLGDIINVKGTLDPIKDQFSEIRINFHRDIIQRVQRNADYNKFLDDLGVLFFSEYPYILDNGSHYHHIGGDPFTDNGIIPTKPELGHILCKGTPLNLGEEYVVLTTKIRSMPRRCWNAKELWDTIRQISVKYKIVVLGEKIVEMNADHLSLGADNIYGIYQDILSNIPNDRIVDLTFPSLGITSPILSRVQQDCLIMQDAKFVITLGIGGNFTMANAVAKTIGFRVDHDSIGNVIYDGKIYPNNMVTRNWGLFIKKLKENQ